jgi:hypothetical protein
LQLAYSDSEIIPSGLGSEYSNLTDNSIHYCTAVSGNSCSSWSVAANSENPVIQNLTSIHPAITPTSIEAVVYADQFPGTDIGAKINAAIAAVGCGEVDVPIGYYSFSTAIVKPRCVLLRGQTAGQGTSGTVLAYTGSLTAMVVADADGANQYPRGGVEDITLAGPGSTGSTIGLFLGGDPTSVISPSGDYGEGQTFTRFRITGFGTGIEWGSNAWLEGFFSASVFANGVGIGEAASAVNSPENNQFFGGAIFNNAGGAVVNANVALNFFGTSFDFNNNGTQSGPVSTGAAIVGSQVFLHGCHLEQWSGPFISAAGFSISGGDAALDSAASITTPYLFDATDGNGQYTVNGISVFSNHAVTDLISWTPAATGSLAVSGLTGNGNELIAAVAPAVALQFGASIVNTNFPGVAGYTVGSTPTFFNAAIVGTNDTNRFTLFDTTGGVTPNKFLLVSSGCLEVDNNAFSAIITKICDNGDIVAAGSMAWGNGGAVIGSSSDVVQNGGTSLTGGTPTCGAGSAAVADCTSTNYTSAGLALASKLTGIGSGTYTTGTSDAVSITWADGGTRTPTACAFSPTNSTAAAATVIGYISAYGSNSVTINHVATSASGGTIAVLCSGN